MSDDPFSSIGLQEMEDRRFVSYWLREDDPIHLQQLWREADRIRYDFVGDSVHLRGLIEISNHCVRQCAYCGLRAGNARLERFRMTEDEILACAADAHRLGLGTVVIQGAEDYGITTKLITAVIRRIKAESPLMVTLSLGERPESDLAAWREAGADRYFLRFETSDARLYRAVHPSRPANAVSRMEMLRKLRSLGYETGSGIMIGIPGQSYASLVEDVLLFRALDLDMIGVGPYLPNPDTPMGCGDWKTWIDPDQQVPNSERMTCKVIALARLYCPEANIPATTALATVNTGKGYELGLTRGANVIMPNITPYEYRIRYQIYPQKHSTQGPDSIIEMIRSRIESIGRTTGKGPGNRTRSPEGVTRPDTSLTSAWRTV